MCAIKLKLVSRQHKPQQKSDDRTHSFTMSGDTTTRSIKRRLVGRRQNSQQNPRQKLYDRPQPPPLPEDIYLRKKSLIILDDEASPAPSEGSSFHSSQNSFLDEVGSQTRESNRVDIMKVVVPAWLEPGKNVQLRYPDGRKFLACIPPRTQWSFENCDGEPRPFFLVPVDPTTGEPQAPPPL